MIMTATMCLALNVYFEARQESLAGQLAVAQVTLNRVTDDRYPDTVCDVVWEDKQFSWTHDGKPDDPTRMDYLDVQAWHTVRKLAESVINDKSLLPGITATHYHAVEVNPFWASHYEFDGQIGGHVFYTNETPYK